MSKANSGNTTVSPVRPLTPFCSGCIGLPHFNLNLCQALTVAQQTERILAGLIKNNVPEGYGQSMHRHWIDSQIDSPTGAPPNQCFRAAMEHDQLDSEIVPPASIGHQGEQCHRVTDAREGLAREPHNPVDQPMKRKVAFRDVDVDPPTGNQVTDYGEFHARSWFFGRMPFHHTTAGIRGQVW
jgi:hypothetical protein